MLLPARGLAGGPAPPPRPVATRSALAVGGVGGSVGGLTAMPGVALTVWLDGRGLAKGCQRAIVQPYILALQIVALALAWPTLGLDRQIVAAAGQVLPSLAAGTALGLALYRQAKPRGFRLGVLAIIAASGVGLVTG